MAGANNTVPIPILAEPYDQFHARATWELKFCWWPQRCEITDQRLWLCLAYRGTAMWTGPGDPVYEFRYHTPTEHLIWQLKQ